MTAADDKPAISYGRSSRLVPASHPCVGAHVLTGADGVSTWWRLSGLWATETAMREDVAADLIHGDVVLMLVPLAEIDRLRAENARLKAQLANEREAADTATQWRLAGGHTE